MNKIINGVASEYDMPMKYENKTTTIFIDTQNMEERHCEQLYQEYLEKENKELKQKVNQLETNRDELKKWLISMINANEHWYNKELTTHDKKYYLENYRITNLSLKNVIEKIDELERGKE